MIRNQKQIKKLSGIIMQEKETKKALFWFRRDLRLNDNTGLYYALKENDVVAPVFIFDKSILSELPVEDRRVEFIWKCIESLKKQLKELGSDIVVRHAISEKEIPLLAKKFKVQAVYTNEDYEPRARQRDGIVKEKLQELGIEFKQFKDQVIFAKSEILTQQKQPYTTFTQYKNSWKKKLAEEEIKTYPVLNFYDKFAKFSADNFPTLEKLGFKSTNMNLMKLEANSIGAQSLFDRFRSKVIGHYKILRDIPYVAGVSYLSVHNRFGTISIRYLVSQIKQTINASSASRKENCEAWLDELIWREFYMQLLYHYPHIAYEPFKSEYKNFQWENNFTDLQSWCEGKTGYPIIDAAMTQLNQTGYMHNRMRMVTASFLTKDLLVDYRMGEEYFALKLLDYDLSANNGGWQWAASTGTDSAGYVRVFNPSRQSEKFDPEGRYIKKYLPIFADVPAKYLHEPWLYKNELEELGIQLGVDYPERIVNHDEQRIIALKEYDRINKLTK